MKPQELFERAVTFNGNGWRAFPVKVIRSAKTQTLIKKPAIKGYHGARPFTAQELRYMPWRNATHVGVTFGPNHCLLDIDIKRGGHGFAHLDQLMAAYGPLPVTATQHTPSGGQHLLFATEIRLGRGIPRSAHLPDGQTSNIDLVRFRNMYAVVYDDTLLQVDPQEVPVLPAAWHPLFRKRPRRVRGVQRRAAAARTPGTGRSSTAELLTARLRNAR